MAQNGLSYFGRPTLQGHVFVYGTLKTGQMRASKWPKAPMSIQRAWTLGTLYDTGPYPAMVAGTDRVAGELWSFADSDLPDTLSVLDRIECTNQPGSDNEYDREVVPVYAGESDERHSAFVYIFAERAMLASFRYLPPKLQECGNIYSIWPEGSNWELAAQR